LIHYITSYEITRPEARLKAIAAPPKHILNFGGGVRVRGGVVNGWGTDKRMDGAQMEVASDWVGLSASTGSAQRLRRGVGFGECVCGGKPSTNENHE